jgi:hypothetical protein
MTSFIRSFLFLLVVGLLPASTLVAADAVTPVYELRIYTANEGKFDDLLARFRDYTVRLFERHGMRNLGYFTPAAGAEGAGRTLIYFLRHDSREAAAASWARFFADSEWVAARAASEAGGAILVGPPESIFLRATDFSPGIGTGYVSFRSPRTFELRRYTATEGRLPALQAFFRNHLLGLFGKHGITGMGFWEPLDANQGAGRELVYLIAFPSRAAADRSWQDLRSDAAFTAPYAEANQAGRLTVENSIRSTFLVPVDFSPVK